ncbi:MAG: 50S ribosomal protein L21 [Candidatus Magasanikbacteria bacterium]|uniref:Large ribosomal subunit protein bL21 n=1 Tax=Candidatus Magasanikbacteria bacterium CG10_big_fil_rev_8_21_14_0_10_38_6 TaxID=1974647 RepID=A0A2M6P201_9BACT|nr:50S ribosomal protein L21 [Candidatus Magasanikbacteria bacterium]NCS72144.1 50S ribosomal protein L21 [Candidatus Magasanikbacteria bacterium]PIR77762.1 MAG: 50S ribosomal protein L21 [Candidatus Magasanikbacteria bacterium CG10_big_fil_rev_8_21_14_0_10_38_6]
MFAVIETGGKQYLVQPGQTITIEKLEAEPGQAITFDKVLLTADKEGIAVNVGTPYLSGVAVTAVVEEQKRDKKVRVVKYKPKIRYKKVFGHRQHLTRVKITDVK